MFVYCQRDVCMYSRTSSVHHVFVPKTYDWMSNRHFRHRYTCISADPTCETWWSSPRVCISRRSVMFRSHDADSQVRKCAIIHLLAQWEFGPCIDSYFSASLRVHYLAYIACVVTGVCAVQVGWTNAMPVCVLFVSSTSSIVFNQNAGAISDHSQSAKDVYR